LAGRLNTVWFVVHVQPPQGVPGTGDSDTSQELVENLERARDMGAEVIRLSSADPVATLLDFARSHGVGDIIVGASRQSVWRQILGFSPLHRLLNQATGFDVHVISCSGESA